MLDKTNLYSASEIESALISKMLFEVYDILKERGYNPINQLLGYLISGDPGYISSYKDARSKITKFERSKVLMAILEGYLEQ